MTALKIEWSGLEGIDLGFITIHYYSLTWVAAFLLGLQIMKRIYKNEGQPEEKLDSLFMYAVLGIMIGARLGHVLFYQSELITQDPLSIFLPARFVPEFEFTGFRGLASHGAAIGAIIAMYLYNKKVLKKSMLWILDRLVIPSMIGGVFIRIGNFFNSEMVGYKTDAPTGVVFKALGEDFARHPGQLYEAFGYIFVFLILWYTYWKTEKRHQEGYIFGLFFVLMFIVRFIVEYFKVAQVDNRADWALNTGQLLSIPFILIGLYFMFLYKKKTPATA